MIRKLILIGVMAVLLTTAAECKEDRKPGEARPPDANAGRNGKVFNNGPGDVWIYYGNDRVRLKGGDESNGLRDVTRMCAISEIGPGDITMNEVKMVKGLEPGECLSLKDGQWVIVFG